MLSDQRWFWSKSQGQVAQAGVLGGSPLGCRCGRQASPRLVAEPDVVAYHFAAVTGQAGDDR